MTVILEIQLIITFKLEWWTLWKLAIVHDAAFVGGGYNRISLAFSSLLCGQVHLNVSTVSCLFRNRLEIGHKH